MILGLQMKSWFIFSLLAVVCAAASSQNAQWSGFYAGGAVGVNHSRAQGLAPQAGKTQVYPSLVAGHQSAEEGVLAGVEFFVDDHEKSVTNKDAGLAFKWGRVWGDWAIYGRVGMTCCHPSTRPQLGAGVQYMVDSNWSVVGQYVVDRDWVSGTRYQNRSLSLGLMRHFK